jgi:putative transposase
MAQSLGNILIHLVFSTKNRERWLDPELRVLLHPYLGGVLQHIKATPIEINSVEDHIHLLLVLPRVLSAAALVEECKVASSKWIKGQATKYHGFAWQTGYGVFSVSPSHREAVRGYIQNQEAHHATVSFQDEVRRLYRVNDLAYDERYVWD